MRLPSFQRVWHSFNEDKVPRLAAALAFSVLFAIAPLFVVLIALAGYVLTVQHVGSAHTLVENALLAPVRTGAGAATAEAVRGLVTSAFNKPRAGLVAQILGWIAFLGGAIGLFSALQDALNTIWRVQPKGGWKQAVRQRFAAFGIILILGFVLLATFVANASLAFVGAHVFRNVFGRAIALRLIGASISLGFTSATFAVVYKILPDANIAWRFAWIGGAVTAVLFILGEALISFYLTVTAVASAYGAAGALLAGLLWIYYSSIVLLLGAELTKEISQPAPTSDRAAA
jgi:membrane protein